MTLATGQPDSRSGPQPDARSGPQPGLTRDRVLDAALGMVEADGIDGLTMRELAGRLGVAVTAIYWHVGNKQTLLDELADRVIPELGSFEVAGTTPEERLLSLARSLRRKLLERSHLFGLVHAQGRNAVLFAPARSIVAGELARCGHDPAAGPGAELAVQALMQHIVGSVLLQQVVDRSPAPAPGQAPPIEEAVEEPVGQAAVFEFGVRTLVRALVEPPGSPAGPG
jgi:AcrR family transcriptional regulator